METDSIRSQFPILDQKVYGKPLVYFDNAATTQKPQSVIDTLCRYYQTLNSNIHRGAHYLAAEATEEYEQTRRAVQQFINARHSHEIVFTRGTTESINLVAASFGQRFLKDGDEVVVSAMEHHSNIVPWQLACEQQGAKLRVIPFDDDGVLDLEALRGMLNEKTRIVAVNHVSNTLGTVNPIRLIVDIAHSHGIPVLVDGAQAISHFAVDVQELGCDFYCFSGHKMYGPMGVGVMYGREELLEQMPPYQGGGEMIKDVTFERTTYNELPTNRYREHCTARERADRIRHRAPAANRGPAHLRQGEREDFGHIVPSGQRASIRCGHAARQAGHSRAHGTPLHAADYGSLRYTRNRKGFVCSIQHARGSGCSHLGNRTDCTDVGLTQLHVRKRC